MTNSELYKELKERFEAIETGLGCILLFVLVIFVFVSLIVCCR